MGCSVEIRDVTWIHEITQVCSQHDESNGTVVVLDTKNLPETIVCRFTKWDHQSLGAIMRGIRLDKKLSYQHELFPKLPYYACSMKG
ncbi:MAG: hypothetical protein H7832_12845 [Magnetococcus sp. DMHC-6]